MNFEREVAGATSYPRAQLSLQLIVFSSSISAQPLFYCYILICIDARIVENGLSDFVMYTHYRNVYHKNFIYFSLTLPVIFDLTQTFHSVGL